MIRVQNIEKFYDIICSMQKDNVPMQLYGYTEETFVGSQVGWETPPNNTLIVRIVALTSLGTIYCNLSTDLVNTDLVNIAKNIYQKLSVIESKVFYDDTSGNITIR